MSASFSQTRIRFLPVFLIAVLAMIYAPALSSLAMAHHANSTGLAPICGDFDPSAPGKNPLAPAHHDCCALCAFAHFGAAPAPLAMELAQPAALVTAPDWIARADRLTYGAMRARAQARAPPQNS